MALCQPESKSNPVPPQEPEKSSTDKLKKAIPGPLAAVIDGSSIAGNAGFQQTALQQRNVDFKLKW